MNVPEGLPHLPVLYQEIIHALQPVSGGIYVDCTLGAGGHAWGILQASAPDGKLLGLDVDPQALQLAHQHLAPFADRVTIVSASYITLREQVRQLGLGSAQGIVVDLGVSSMQLDTAQRGFSFQADAPLDMRFNPENPVMAADLVNGLAEKELADLIYRYGEEQRARQIARAVVRARPLNTTRELAEIILRCSGRSSKHRKSEKGQRGMSLHPATRTFQALRIAVNRELEALEVLLPQTLDVLAPGGRVAVIAFHSLEDRIVKQFFRRESQDCICPPRQPVCTCGHRAVLREINRRPIQPQAAEIEQNPRSRSARLRVAERLTS